MIGRLYRGIPTASSASAWSVLLCAGIAAAEPTPKHDAKRVTVYREEARYGGWPANHGIWQWGDEIVVGFTSAWYEPAQGGHAVDFKKPFEKWQARSLDGGLTWAVEKPEAIAKAPRMEATPALKEAIDFTAPNFALMFEMGHMHVGPSRFYASADRCRTWAGPHAFAVDGIDKVATRTDLVVLGPRDCLAFGSAAEEGRTFCARTRDGGLTWKLVSRIGPEPEGYAFMPSTVRLGAKKLLTTVRRFDPVKLGSIDAYLSEDLGEHWTALPPPRPASAAATCPACSACATAGWRWHTGIAPGHSACWPARAPTRERRGRSRSSCATTASPATSAIARASSGPTARSSPFITSTGRAARTAPSRPRSGARRRSRCPARPLQHPQDKRPCQLPETRPDQPAVYPASTDSGC